MRASMFLALLTGFVPLQAAREPDAIATLPPKGATLYIPDYARGEMLRTNDTPKDKAPWAAFGPRRIDFAFDEDEHKPGSYRQEFFVLTFFKDENKEDKKVWDRIVKGKSEGKAAIKARAVCYISANGDPLGVNTIHYKGSSPYIWTKPEELKGVDANCSEALSSILGLSPGPK